MAGTPARPGGSSSGDAGGGLHVHINGTNAEWLDPLFSNGPCRRVRTFEDADAQTWRCECFPSRRGRAFQRSPHIGAEGVENAAIMLAMDPARKRRVRFVVALTAALMLTGALIFTSFSAATQTMQPSQLRASAEPDKVYELTGKVEKGSWDNRGSTHSFRVEDRKGGGSVQVRYDAPVPDPFREGREVIIDVRKHGDTFVGEENTLITKCPSKFSAEEQQAKRQ